jgi:predicted metalloprotease with PDZ domain
MHILTLRAAAVVAVFATSAAAQDVAYEVAFPNAVHHEAQVTLTLTGLPPGPLQLRMSRASPGRYALHEFAKNVYAVRAVDGGGRALPVTRPDPYGWDVADHDGTVRVSYTVFGDLGDGTYAQIDETHAHLNMPAAFMWARGLDRRPIRITFRVPERSGWKIATQLVPTAEPATFTAPGLQYFMDSPTELSAFSLREWPVTAGGRTASIRLAVHHLGDEADVDRYAAMARAVVPQAIAVFGELPAFDRGTYTLIACYLPWAGDDGMEHRNSTFLTEPAALRDGAPGLLGTLSHEFFHAWNVERLRPRALEPFDFERANMSGELWFAEGFTSYYGPLLIARAGLATAAQYAHRLSQAVSQVITSPARGFASPVEISLQAPLVDAAAAVDPTNRHNTFLSYYTWGSVVGLGLDLTVRRRFGITLDDYMRLLWARHGRPEVPYTLDDLERALAEVTRDSAFARDFFARFVRGREVPDLRALLGGAGFLLRPAHPGRAFLGLVQLDYGTAGARIDGGTQVGSPLYQAGLDRNDVIVSLDGRPLAGDAVWQAVKAAHRPGDVIAVEYVSRGRRETGRITLVEDPRLEVVTYEEAGMPVTDAMRRFREAWLGRE